MEICYEIRKDMKTGLYSLSFNGVEVADGLEIMEAVLMLETFVRNDFNGEGQL